jgi:hypothetical protein
MPPWHGGYMPMACAMPPPSKMAWHMPPWHGTCHPGMVATCHLAWHMPHWHGTTCHLACAMPPPSKMACAMPPWHGTTCHLAWHMPPWHGTTCHLAWHMPPWHGTTCHLAWHMPPWHGILGGYMPHGMAPPTVAWHMPCGMATTCQSGMAHAIGMAHAKFEGLYTALLAPRWLLFGRPNSVQKCITSGNALMLTCQPGSARLA